MKHFSKYVCCFLDVTIASRVIGLIGILISVVLVSVLLSDKYSGIGDNYDLSRNTALAFGIDWQHFHQDASTSHEDDPEGRMISILVIFYSIVFLVINMLLLFATIKYDWRYTIPWLTCEFFGCSSKFGALIYHLCLDPENFSKIFITGSIMYIVVMIWFWLVVYSAQSSWKERKKSSFILELSILSSRSTVQVKDCEEGSSATIRLGEDVQNVDSPGPYQPNNKYALI